MAELGRKQPLAAGAKRQLSANRWTLESSPIDRQRRHHGSTEAPQGVATPTVDAG